MTEATDPDLTPEGIASAASEEQLGNLHAVVAQALTTVIAEGQPIVDKEGNVIKVPASAAHIGAAIAFLKNNNITASPTKNKDLAALRQTLNKKRARRELSKPDLDEAAAAFAAMQGQNGMMQ